MLIIGIILSTTAVIGFIILSIQNIDEFPLILTGFFTGFLWLLGVIAISADCTQEKTEFKYPTTEYTLEYEIITKGEQIDSTYVISKIE